MPDVIDPVALLGLLAAPLAACVILTGIHCYLGIHVLMREVIFVDLALAQIAGMGMAFGVLFGVMPATPQGYLVALSFTLVGAAIFALGRFRDRRVPQEAVIGIVYAVSSAVAILALSKTAIESDEIENMLVGRLLFVGWTEVAVTTVIYAAIGVIHIFFRRRFFAISHHGADAGSGLSVKLWDFLFYATFGVVVTSSVKMAGVLLVFCFLIVPAACAMMFFRSVRARLLAGWGLGLLGSVLGLTASALWDLPTGAAIVAAFGALFLACAAFYAVIGRKITTTPTQRPDQAPDSEPRLKPGSAMEVGATR